MINRIDLRSGKKLNWNYDSNDSTIATELSNEVAQIIAQVKQQGAVALLDFVKRFDGYGCATIGELQCSLNQNTPELASLDPKLADALKQAYHQINAFHTKQLQNDILHTDEYGNQISFNHRPINKVALYVPGGRAIYPSSLLMNAIPAKIAGVKKIYLLTPSKTNKINPILHAAASLCQLDTCYLMGGAHAIAAVAYGCEDIPKVDLVTGPGNAYVTEAKRQLSSTIGTDLPAGPSEVLIISDDSCNPQWVAADLLAQAEHDPLAKCQHITWDANHQQQVISCLQQQLTTTARSKIVQAALKNHGLFILLDDKKEAAICANQIASEHLQLMCRDADNQYLEQQITNFGALFIGHYSSAVFGDYCCGSNHVLPTDGSARFTGGLSVAHFMRSTSTVKISANGAKHLAPIGEKIAQAENLSAHAYALNLRKQEQN